MNFDDITKIMAASEKMYRLLARLYKKEVDAVLLTQLKSMKLPYVNAADADVLGADKAKASDKTKASDKADVKSDSVSEVTLEAGWKQLGTYLSSVDVTEETITILAADYAKVFLAAGSAKGRAAVPYESVYTSKKRIIMQEAWEETRAIYHEKGLKIGNAASDYMEDHIACELEYMAWLCAQCAAAGKAAKQQKSNERYDIHKYLEDQLAFLKTHLLIWVQAFYEDIVKYSDTEFYKALGQITAAYLFESKDVLECLGASLELQ